MNSAISIQLNCTRSLVYFPSGKIESTLQLLDSQNEYSCTAAENLFTETENDELFHLSRGQISSGSISHCPSNRREALRAKGSLSINFLPPTI